MNAQHCVQRFEHTKKALDNFETNFGKDLKLLRRNEEHLLLLDENVAEQSNQLLDKKAKVTRSQENGAMFKKVVVRMLYELKLHTIWSVLGKTLLVRVRTKPAHGKTASQ